MSIAEAFLAAVKDIRRRARLHLGEGTVTQKYGRRESWLQ